MATHRSPLLPDGDTPVREDPTSVIVISEASRPLIVQEGPSKP
jgi:hypothetical protein